MVRVVPEYKEEARRQILQKAIEIFAQHGYHATTMNDIAHAVGVSKRAIYLYFDSKETLFAEMVAWNQEGGLNRARAYFSYYTGKNVLEAMFEHWFSLIEERFLHLSMEITSLSYQNPRLQEILREDREQDFKILSSLLEEQQKKGAFRRR
jgi:AcrR family transcriptional regulator